MMKLENYTELQVFNKIYMWKESVINKFKPTINPWIII